MIELVVFDVAGTTLEDDDCVLTAFTRALAEHDVAASAAEVKSVMGLAKPLAIRELLANHRPFDPTEDEVQAVHRAFVDRMIRHYEESPDVRPIPGAETTFEILRAAGVRVALDTGFSRDILDAILARLGWTSGLLDATVASSEVPRGRPYPDMIHRAMSLCGVASARHVAKVGDTPADVQQGRRAGCPLVVGVTSGTASAEELWIDRPTHVVRSVAELPGLLRDWEARGAMTASRVAQL